METNPRPEKTTELQLKFLLEILKYQNGNKRSEIEENKDITTSQALQEPNTALHSEANEPLLSNSSEKPVLPARAFHHYQNTHATNVVTNINSAALSSAASDSNPGAGPASSAAASVSAGLPQNDIDTLFHFVLDKIPKVPQQLFDIAKNVKIKDKNIILQKLANAEFLSNRQAILMNKPANPPSNGNVGQSQSDGNNVEEEKEGVKNGGQNSALLEYNFDWQNDQPQNEREVLLYANVGLESSSSLLQNFKRKDKYFPLALSSQEDVHSLLTNKLNPPQLILQHQQESACVKPKKGVKKYFQCINVDENILEKSLNELDIYDFHNEELLLHIKYIIKLNSFFNKDLHCEGSVLSPNQGYLKPIDLKIISTITENNEESFYELCNYWLYTEYSLFGLRNQIVFLNRYKNLLKKMLSMILSQEYLAGEKSVHWENFIKNLPLLTHEVIDHILWMCVNCVSVHDALKGPQSEKELEEKKKSEERMKNRMEFLRDLILNTCENIEITEYALDGFLKMTTHIHHQIKAKAILVLCHHVYNDQRFRETIQKFAIDNLNALQFFKGNEPESKIHPHIALILALTRENKQLIRNIFSIFAKVKENCKNTILKIFPSLIKKRKDNFEDKELILAIENSDFEELPLVEKCIETFLEKLEFYSGFKKALAQVINKHNLVSLLSRVLHKYSISEIQKYELLNILLTIPLDHAHFQTILRNFLDTFFQNAKQNENNQNVIKPKHLLLEFHKIKTANLDKNEFIKLSCLVAAYFGSNNIDASSIVLNLKDEFINLPFTPLLLKTFFTIFQNHKEIKSTLIEIIKKKIGKEELNNTVWGGLELLITKNPSDFVHIVADFPEERRKNLLNKYGEVKQLYYLNNLDEVRKEEAAKEPMNETERINEERKDNGDINGDNENGKIEEPVRKKKKLDTNHSKKEQESNPQKSKSRRDTKDIKIKENGETSHDQQMQDIE